MRSSRTDFATVKKLASSLSGVEESTMYGSPALKVRGNLLACLAIHKSAEPHTLAVRIDFARRDELIAADPDVYYLKDHYVKYPIVLVRLTRIHSDALRDLLGMSWRFVTAKTRTAARGMRKPRDFRPPGSARHNA